MGKRERKKWDLPSEQWVPLASLSGFFLLGGLCGSIFASLADGQGGQELCDYLRDYLGLVRDGALFHNFWSGLWEELRYLLAVFLLGLTGIGVVGLPLLFGVRGFFFAFSVACFCRVFGSSGLLPALFLFGLPALLWGPALFLSGVQGLNGSRKLLLRGLGDGRDALPFAPVYWGKLTVSFILILLCGLVEYHVIPVLLRAAARVVL